MELELNNNETKWKKQNKNNSKINKNNSKNINKGKGFDNTTKTILSKPLKNIYEFRNSKSSFLVISVMPCTRELLNSPDNYFLELVSPNYIKFIYFLILCYNKLS